MFSNLIVWGLAVFWLSNTLAKYDGPGDKIKEFRDKLEFYLGSWSPLHCPYCTSFWVLIIFGLLFHFFPIILYFFAVLGASAVFRGVALEV